MCVCVRLIYLPIYLCLYLLIGFDSSQKTADIYLLIYASISIYTCVYIYICVYARMCTFMIYSNTKSRNVYIYIEICNDM